MSVRASILILIFAAAATAAKPADVEVTSMSLRRQGDLILVDTTLKNTGGKPLKALVAIYKFYSAGHEVLSTQRTSVEEAVLEPGQETEIHAQLSAPPKAVTAEFGAAISGGRELRAGNTGPFSIE